MGRGRRASPSNARSRLKLLPFTSDAAEELDDAVAFYERERAGYGALFFIEVGRKLERAARFPQSGVRAGGFGLERDVRQFKLNKFPYAIITAVVDGERAVIAVAHLRRSPGYWKKRIK